MAFRDWGIFRAQAFRRRWPCRKGPVGLCGADGVFLGIQGLIGVSTTGVVGLDRGQQSCF